MTDREIITEFILQQIKQNDLVEINTKDHEIIKGYIADKDVFPVLHSALQTQNALYKTNFQPPKVIRLILVSDKGKSNSVAMANMFSILMPPVYKERSIPVEEISSIKKITE